jgi:hypothetical protein
MEDATYGLVVMVDRFEVPDNRSRTLPRKPFAAKKKNIFLVLPRKERGKIKLTCYLSRHGTFLVGATFGSSGTSAA